MSVIDRGDYWHVVCEVPKGGWAGMRGSIEAVRAVLAETVPFLADRAHEITAPADGSLLEVRVDRLERWHTPGLLCIGDAAHAMSPVGGFGVNLAVQDAVAAANLLTGPLLLHQRSGTPVGDAVLNAVRRRRRLPTAVAQGFQRLAQRSGLERAQRGERVLSGPFALARWRPVRRLTARMIGVGVRPERVRTG